MIYSIEKSIFQGNKKMHPKLILSPFIIMLLFSFFIPTVSALLNQSFLKYIPIFYLIILTAMLIPRNPSGYLTLSKNETLFLGVYFFFIIFCILSGRGIASGGTLITTVSVFLLVRLIKLEFDLNTAIEALIAIYMLHIVSLLCELLFCLLGYQPLLVDLLTNNGSGIKAYKDYNSAPLLRQYLDIKASGLNSMLLGSQSASMVSAFSSILFLGLWASAGKQLFLIPAFAASFLIPFTVTNTSMLLFLPMFIILMIAIAFIFTRSASQAIITFTVISLSIFAFHREIWVGITLKLQGNWFEAYYTAFLNPVLVFMDQKLFDMIFGAGRSAHKFVEYADFGFGVLLVGSGLFFMLLFMMPFFKIFIGVVTVLMKAPRSKYKILLLTNSMLCFAYLGSLIHYTTAIEVGARELFAMHIAISFVLIEKYVRKTI